jgi:outer membrane protein assembly factor BamB
VEGGDHSSPAVSAAGVFVSYACNQTYGFSLTCGTQLWHHMGPCEGGGGATVLLLDDRVYTRDSNGDLVLDAASGAQLGTYASAVIPAGANGVLYMLSDGKLSARSAGATTPLWTFGDGSLATAPLRVGANVVVSSTSGQLSVLSADDGSVASSYKLSAAVTPDTFTAVGPVSGMAAAENQLFVPSGTSLIAF